MTAKAQEIRKKAWPAVRRLWLFFLSELKALLRVFFKAFWKGALATTAIIFVLLTVLVWTSDRSGESTGRSGFGDAVVQLLVILGFAVWYGLMLGVVTGAVRSLWHLCGRWIVFPLIVIPLSIVLTFWVASGWLHGEAVSVLTALKQSAENHGLPETSSALGGMKGGAHAGPVAVIFIVLLLPFFLVDAFHILVDTSFLLQLLYFFLCFALVVLAGSVPASCVSGLILSIAFIKRLYARYREFQSNKPDVR